MFACLPCGICSWDYQIYDNDLRIAELSLSVLLEQGTIRHQADFYQVTKDGFLSGQWALGRAGLSVATASKPSPFSRSFELNSGGRQWTLSALSILSRSFEIRSNAGMMGNIYPAHFFTRRAFIACEPVLPVPIQLFAFCLVVFLWRRAARDSAPAVAST